MPIIYSYPTVQPVLSDSLMGVSYEEGAGNSVKNFTVGDVINLGLNQAQVAQQPITLTFNWSKEQTVNFTEPLYGRYFKLGIDFNGLTLEEGAEYTLLIDRWRYQENLGKNGKFRKSRYYHEVASKAIENVRFSELPITSTNGQYFDFVQKNYFTQGLTPNNTFKSGSGKCERRSISKNRGIFHVNLSFRLRINRSGIITETESLGTISLAAKSPGITAYWVISYAYPKS